MPPQYTNGVYCMINKDKITKADVYNEKGELMFTTRSITFPKDFFKLKGLELVSIRGNDLPFFKKSDVITVIFEYINGTRLKCVSKVDISTQYQLNFHVGEGEVLEERRRSFKVKTQEPTFIYRIERGEEIIDLEIPQRATVLNINLGGVLMTCEMELIPGDIVSQKVLPEGMDVRSRILRRQTDRDGNLIGYGCCFLDITAPQEEKIARHLMDCQLAERDRRRKEGGY